jgi:hypothetical protein
LIKIKAKAAPDRQSFPVDIDPGQIVRWVIAERKAGPSSLKTVARRSTELREIPAGGAYHLGEDERTDLSELTCRKWPPSQH